MKDKKENRALTNEEITEMFVRFEELRAEESDLQKSSEKETTIVNE